MKRNTTFFILIFIFLCSSLFPVNIYISKLQAFYKARSDTDNLSRKADSISNQLKKELMEQSSEIITYNDLGSLAQKQRREYDAEPITDTLDALAVCFFYNIDFILFGELYIGGDAEQYRVQMKLYSKISGDVIHVIDYSSPAGNDSAFVTGLATTINQELMVKIAGVTEDSKITDKKTDEDRVLDKVRDNLDEQTDGDSSADDDKDREAAGSKITKEKIFGVWISLGYFIQIHGEWTGIVMPTATLEQGVNWSLRAIDGKTFDFYIRPSLLFNYSFSVQNPYNTYHNYIHYHSLTVKANVDFFFEFYDFFGFFAGFGPHYKIDIIDFRVRSADFYTDITYALGLSANAGVQLSLNKEKNLDFGLNNIFDFTFYQNTYIDYKILAFCILRI
ncbi:MAG: hypothetical protein JXJ04_12515 [Spirochaetales bacterium]|nr:hypothetical protein [Spirochaetales bacterium]